jgi:hypothetical protein
VIEVNKQYKFNYPLAFITLPKYSEHRGQTATVVRALDRGTEYDYEGDAMFEVQFADGWVGEAFESELEELA